MANQAEGMEWTTWGYRVAHRVDTDEWFVIEAYYADEITHSIRAWCKASLDESAQSFDELRDDVTAMQIGFLLPVVEIDAEDNVLCERPREGEA
jgi:hypothetical protein